MAAIATVTGTALVPGVSRNRRLYTTDLIDKAVRRAQARLAEPDGMPLTMRIAHPEPDKAAFAPVTEIVGRVTEIWQEADGRARFRAELIDTQHGTDVLKLVDNRAGKPVLKNVSIRGNWLGRTRKVVAADGEMAETADDLDLDGLDYTHKPGVIGAEIEHVADPGGEPRESGPDGRTPIFESVMEALVETIVEEATAPAVTPQASPAGDVVYADPGYQKDKKKRYPLDTKRRAKSAWSYINQANNAKLYTAAQLKRVRARIVKALKKFGVTVDVGEGWLIDPVGAITESAVAEHLGMDEQPGSFSINLSNGPLSINVSSWCIDPHDLDAIGRAAMTAACAALAAIDPDLDGDIDVPGAGGEDTDGDARALAGESDATDDGDDLVEESTAVVDEPTNAPAPAGDLETPRQDAVETPTMKEAVVSDATTTPAVETAAPASAAPAGVFLSDAQFAALLARVGAPAAPAAVPAPAPVEAAPAAPAAVAETAPAAVAETDDERIARIVEAQVQQRMDAYTRQVQETVQRQGPPARKGLVGRVTESGELAVAGAAGGAEVNSQGLPASWPDKPLHQYTAEERSRHLGAALVEHVVGSRIR